MFEDGGCNSVIMSIKDTCNVRIKVSDVIRLDLALHNDAGGRTIK
ncbi:hypothetical protein A2U01_0112588, partial [Trifolium medium]|nr:hypothetical protein [Trifolium medium]